VDVRPLITHRLALDETAEAFRLVAEAGDSLKVIVEPQR
jgi:L-iditol 2-dehydrogenase